MAVDPRKFNGVKFQCKKSAALEAQEQNAKMNSLKGLKNLAGIEPNSKLTGVLNDFVRASDSGGPKLNSILNDGVNGTIGLLGMNPEKVNGTLQSINPNAVNTGIGAIQSMHQRMKTGKLKASNLPAYTRDVKGLMDVYDNAIIKKDAEPDSPARTCFSSPYSADLVSLGIKMKFMFIVEFVFNVPYSVDTSANNRYVVSTLVKQSGRPGVNYEHEEINMYNFRTKVIKNSTFEPIEMILIDDDKNNVMEFLMNYFRATIPSTNKNPIDLEESGMVFERDSIASDLLQNYDRRLKEIESNYATRNVEIQSYQQNELNIIDAQMRKDEKELAKNIALFKSDGEGGIRPASDAEEAEIKKMQAKLKKEREEREKTINDIEAHSNDLAKRNYDEQIRLLGDKPSETATTAQGSASIGALDNNSKTILKEIKIFHIHDHGTQMNAYHIHNPKILQATMDELNMEDSSGSHVTLSIGYDTFDVDTSITLHGETNSELAQTNETLGVLYHLHDDTYVPPVSAKDITANAEATRAEEQESYDESKEPEFTTNAPDGSTLYSEDGVFWEDKSGFPVLPGDEFEVIDAETGDVSYSSFTPIEPQGIDGYGVPTNADGTYVDYSKDQFTPIEETL